MPVRERSAKSTVPFSRPCAKICFVTTLLLVVVVEK